MPHLSAKEKALNMWVHHTRPRPIGRLISCSKRKLYFKVLAQHYKGKCTLPGLPLLLELQEEMEEEKKKKKMKKKKRSTTTPTRISTIQPIVKYVPNYNHVPGKDMPFL